MSVIPSYLLPDTAEMSPGGELKVGGVSIVEVADEYGTPAFVYDQKHLERRCTEAVSAFPNGVAYASKAFLCVAMARIAAEAGMRIDVASGGEMHVALNADVPPERLVFHGNNKSDQEIAKAIDVGVGLIVVDSFDEIARIERVHDSMRRQTPVKCLLRVTPGIEAHTHEFIRTGQDDSKFGFGLHSGDAQRAVNLMKKSKIIELTGIHAHVGSQIFDASAFEQEVEVLAPFVTENELHEMCIGGGLGVPYVTGEAAPSITEWGNAINKAVESVGLQDVAVTAEPGRSIAATAGMTLYTVGTIKEVPGIRTYLSVDGGMSDNPRPVLYGSGYEAFLPREAKAERTKTVTIVGKHCESGDFLIKDASLPSDVAIGDVLVTPVTGAYGHTMASNYNRLQRPPVLMVKEGAVRTVVRRETEADLVRLDLQ